MGGESRWQVALREVRETRRAIAVCRLLPVMMGCHAPPAVETELYGDVLRMYSDSTELSSLQIRSLESEGDVELIRWFIAVVV